MTLRPSYGTFKDDPIFFVFRLAFAIQVTGNTASVFIETLFIISTGGREKDE